MALIVQKYGGSSVATPEKIKELAQKIVLRHQSGDQLIIVVSAMGKTTNELLSKAQAVASKPDPRELDVLLSVGERITIALMSMAINELQPGLALSLTGSQIGLVTDCNHTDARIMEIKGERLKRALQEGRIPVVAGFQGVSLAKEITTLGRGGSDTTAVAVAAAVGADSCEIYSDVDGVYSADPRLCSEAFRLPEISYDTMLEASSLGAKVLKDEAVEYAKRLQVKIACGSSSDGFIGTIVSNNALNQNLVSTIVTYDQLHYCYSQKSGELLLQNPDLRYYQSNGTEELYIYDSKHPLPESQSCSVTALVGTGIRSLGASLQLVNQLLAPYTILALNCTNLHYEVFTAQKPQAATIEQIHGLLFNE